MKICILTPRFPFPENGGDVLRINNIARYLKSKGNEVILCSFGKNVDLEYVNEDLYSNIYIVSKSKFGTLKNSLIYFLTFKPIQCGYYFSNKFLKMFKSVIEKEHCDLYVSHLCRMVPYLEVCNLQDKSIVEMTDALSKTYFLSANSTGFSIKKLIYKFEKNRIKKYEQKVIREYKKVVLVSEEDKKLIGNNENISVLTNGVNCMESVSYEYNPNKITFVGNMRTLQNQDAALYFTKEIFPLVKEKCPDAFFEIIGAQPSEQIKSLDDGKNIIVTGFVDSVEKELKDSCVTVAPVRIAAGIQNKVLVSMACGVPVVLTSLISSAIPELKNGENCIIEDNAEKIAFEICSIINNSEKRNLLGNSGYEMVKKNYSWDAKLAGYENI